MGRIVAGLDHGGSHDDAVVAAALAQARRTGSEVRVVHAIPPEGTTAMDSVDAASKRARSAARQSMRQAIEEDLRRHVASTTDDFGSLVTMAVDVHHGDPATVLLSASRHADLIVIGTYGAAHRSPFLLGTVSQDIAVHATCPVLLIPTS